MSRFRHPLLWAGLLALIPLAARAQNDATALGPRLAQEAAIARALEAIKADEPQTLADQARICEVEAPPFKETRRGVLYAQLFREAGLTNVRTDKVGNVLGEFRGAQARPHLVFAAHLDTVFPEGTDVRVRRDGATLIVTVNPRLGAAGRPSSARVMRLAPGASIFEAPKSIM